MKHRMFSLTLVFVVILLISSSNIVLGQSILEDSHVLNENAPECWKINDEISFTGEKIIHPEIAEQRVSTYEIHDDDTVTPNHILTGLPYYYSLTWQGSSDVEWLDFNGVYSSYTIDSVNHTVTFYDLQDRLQVVYRTHNFVQRTPDQIRFCVIGENGGIYRDTQVRVLYPAYYEMQSATPPGYIIPAPGELHWYFGSIDTFQVDTYFNGLGPDRPLLDLPVDYDGREMGSIAGFTAAYLVRTNALFDHEFPTYQYNSFFRPYSGIEYPSSYCPAGTYGFTCYDGHDGYDIDDRCPANAPCANASAVYPAADGTIIQPTGWNDILGCRITIDHGNNWVTSYNHLLDSLNNHSCNGILLWSGQVTKFQQIGIIGNSGSGSFGSHLHFTVKHNGIVVDPSGWEGNPQVNPDPWAQAGNGAVSYPMWLYSIRTTQVLDPSLGGQIASPTHNELVDVPIGFYNQPLMFNLSDQPVNIPFSTYFSSGHSFSLNASDAVGNYVHQLDQSITIRISFDLVDLQNLDPNTLSIYSLDGFSNNWIQIPTDIDWNTMTASAQVDNLSNFALIGRAENLMFLPVINR